MLNGINGETLMGLGEKADPLSLWGVEDPLVKLVKTL